MTDEGELNSRQGWANMIRIQGKKRAWWQLAGAQVVLGCASPPGLLIMWNERSTFLPSTLRVVVRRPNDIPLSD